MRKLFIVLVVLTSLMLIPAVSALAANSPSASCMGHESSSISPKGSSDEVPGGRPELNGIFKSFGVPQGQVVKQVAHAHAGSHDLCDAAFE